MNTQIIHKKYIIELNNILHMDTFLNFLGNCKGPIILMGEGMYLDLNSVLSQIFAKAILQENGENPYYLEVSTKEDYDLVNDFLNSKIQ